MTGTALDRPLVATSISPAYRYWRRNRAGIIFVLPALILYLAFMVYPFFRSILDVLDSASAGQTQLGYNIDVLAPPEFNDMMTTGFQAILAGDKTAEQQAADLEAAWQEGMSAAQATPSS